MPTDRLSPLRRLALGLLLAIPTPFAAAQAPATQEKAKAAPQGPERYEDDIRAFEKADQSAPPPEGAVLFYGASSTRLWTTLAKDFPEVTVINRGFGGSQASDLLYFAERVAIPYKPRLVVVQTGGNDIAAGKSPEQAMADVKALVAKLRRAQPGVRIAFQSINPTPLRWAQAEKQQAFNRMLKEYTESVPNLDYIDIWTPLLGPDGQPRADLYGPDRLHHNEAGYKVRAEAIRPHLAAASATAPR